MRLTLTLLLLFSFSACTPSADTGSADAAREAIQHYETTAREGSLAAKVTLAGILRTGIVRNDAQVVVGTVPRDPAEADRLMQEALDGYQQRADGGDLDARTRLGVLRLEADDPEAGFANLQTAAEAGHPAAMSALGYLKHWAAQDYAAALAWLRPAAEQGDAEAQYLLHVAYRDGYGVTPDATVSRMWLQRAASADHALAVRTVRSMEAQGL